MKKGNGCGNGCGFGVGGAVAPPLASLDPSLPGKVEYERAGGFRHPLGGTPLLGNTNAGEDIKMPPAGFSPCA